MEKYELNKLLNDTKLTINNLAKVVEPENKKEQIDLLKEKMSAADFWDKPKEATKVSKELVSLEKKLATYFDFKSRIEELVEFEAITSINTDEWTFLEDEIINLNKELTQFQTVMLLSEKYDSFNCYLEVHSGSGGTEACDWAQMLLRMFQRYCAHKGFKATIIDYLPGEGAGIKSATLYVEGEYSYGFLKAERGVHRLVRISPFDSNSKRHTSFASIDVVPEIDDELNVVIKDDDIKIDVYRSSGAGGQSVNTTDSAVRITHIPTNIIVTCQNERSQIKNRETCMKMLKSKLVELELKKQEEELARIKGNQKLISWGSQIRSYVFQPYQLVKDHRTNYEVGNTADVMDGNLDGFINAYLHMRKE